MPILRQRRVTDVTMVDEVDARLVARARRDRDADAFGEIYRRHFPAVYGYCYRSLGGVERAEDAAQQVFEQVLGALPTYREVGRFRSWLFTIAYHVIQKQQSAQRPLTTFDAIGEVADPDTSPEEQVLTTLEHRELMAALDRLSPDQRRVVELRLAGLKGREIAAELGRSHEAVRMLQHRALERLAAELVAARQPTEQRRGA